VSPSRAADLFLAQVPRGDTSAVPHQLTPREVTVLTLLAESMTAKSIARRLDISARTVNKHLENLYRNLETSDRPTTVMRPGSGAAPAVVSDNRCSGRPGCRDQASRKSANGQTSIGAPTTTVTFAAQASAVLVSSASMM